MEAVGSEKARREDWSAQLLMLPEITDFAGPLALIAGGLTLAVASTSLTRRVAVPAPVVFLAGAAIASDVVPSLGDHVGILTVERIAVVALIVILFNGGRDIGAARFRASLRDISAIGLLGTFVTAAALAVVIRILVGFDWAVSGVLGAALAPTDPAVMFSVLGQREIGGRSGTVLEGEAGINDPAGIALLLGMVQVATHPGTSMLIVLREFAVEMGIGAALGIIGGTMLTTALRRLRLGGSSLYPVLALGLAGLLYGVTSLAHGSGFFAVFIAGLVLGDARLPYRAEIDQFTSGLASLAEVAVFLALGLTIHISAIAGRDWLAGLGILLVSATVVRPAVVVITLARSKLTRTERTFVAWSGLKGAVPILLAAFAILAGVEHAQRIYDLVFVVVLGSVVLQGGLVPAVRQPVEDPHGGATRAALGTVGATHRTATRPVPVDRRSRVVRRRQHTRAARRRGSSMGDARSARRSRAARKRTAHAPPRRRRIPRRRRDSDR